METIKNLNIKVNPSKKNLKIGGDLYVFRKKVGPYVVNNYFDIIFKGR